jgi:hypothetical protein
MSSLQPVSFDLTRLPASRNRNGTDLHPFGVCCTTLGGTVESVLGLFSIVVVAYTNGGYLRGAYKPVSICTNESRGPTEA